MPLGGRLPEQVNLIITLSLESMETDCVVGETVTDIMRLFTIDI